MKTKTNKPAKRFDIYILLVSAFVIAASGLGYELVAGTVSSYLLGDSVTHFSLTIGVFMAAMGVGSYLSKFILRNEVERFIELEIIIGLFGGFSATLLFLSYGSGGSFHFTLWFLIILIGILVGTEIPLLLRILKNRLKFRELVSQVLSLDYIGGLAAAVLFPLALLPKLGLIETSLLFGILNIIAAMFAVYVFRHQIAFRRYMLISIIILLALFTALLFGKKLDRFTLSMRYADRVIYSERTAFQQIVLTRWRSQTSLFINDHQQFNSWDEYRYHETLVHPAIAIHRSLNPDRNRLKALVLGGGDGLGIREVLKHEHIKKIVLVDLDPGITDLARDHSFFREINNDALRSKKVQVINDDAFVWLNKTSEKFDLIFIDFPDPTGFSIGKLYSETFYRRLNLIMTDSAIAVTQATSPLVARRSFYSIKNTIEAAGFYARPLHAYIPSFGEWGFIMFASDKFTLPQNPELPGKLSFLNHENFRDLFSFSIDMAEVEAETQRLNSQKLVHYYENEWRSVVK